MDDFTIAMDVDVRNMQADGFYPLFADKDRTVMVKAGEPVTEISPWERNTFKVHDLPGLTGQESFLLTILWAMASHETAGIIDTGKNHLSTACDFRADRVLTGLRDKGYVRFRSTTRTVIVLERKTIDLLTIVEAIAG